MLDFDKDNSPAPTEQKPKTPGSSTVNKSSAIRLTAKEQLLADHLADWDNYTPEKGTDKVYHLLVEQVHIKDLDFKSHAHVAKINQASFQRYVSQIDSLGITLHKILFDPNPEKTKEVMGNLEQIKKNNLKIKA